MADRTVGRESRGHMVRICCAVEIRLVAGIAGRWSVRVIVVRMALGAGQRGMSSGQWIVGIHRVIEVDVDPVRSRVARVAGRGKPGSRVAGVRRSIPIRLMAAVASGRKRAVVVIRMALCAAQCCMRSR